MAIIHAAPNLNELKIEQYIESRLAQIRRSYENSEGTRTVIKIAGIGIMLACIGFIAALIWYPGFLAGMQDWSEKLVLGWGENIAAIDFGFGDPDLPFLVGILRTVVGIAANLVMDLIGIFLALVSYAMPLLTAVVLFVGAGALLFMTYDTVHDAFKSFDEKWERDIICKNLPDEIRVLQAGVAGEQRSLDIVKKLGHDCHVFSNLDIRFGGNHNETDLITVTPTGLTVIEVKNYSGTLQGDLSEKQLTQVKFSRKGNPYPETCDNPMDQIEVPARRLEKYLRSRGIQVPVRRCCLFVHDSAKLEVTDYTGRSAACPLFVWKDPGFTRYLHSSQSRSLNGYEIEKIVSALERFL